MTLDISNIRENTWWRTHCIATNRHNPLPQLHTIQKQSKWDTPQWAYGQLQEEITCILFYRGTVQSWASETTQSCLPAIPFVKLNLSRFRRKFVLSGSHGPSGEFIDWSSPQVHGWQKPKMARDSWHKNLTRNDTTLRWQLHVQLIFCHCKVNR